MKKIIDPDYDYEYCILKNKLGIKEENKLKQVETDLVIVRIAEIFKNMYFEPSSEYFRELHNYLFGDIYYFAGKYRSIHIEKSEKVLAGLSALYSEPERIKDEVEGVFDRIKNTDFYSLNKEERIDYVTEVLTSLWQTHPFREGNTRTCLVFLRTFLNSYGITFDSDLFKNEGNYKYTRNALVAASFEADDLGVKRNYVYIRRLISDIMEEEINTKRGI